MPWRIDHQPSIWISGLIMNIRCIYTKLFGTDEFFSFKIIWSFLFEFTTVPSKTMSCENVSRPRKIPQIDSDSRCAFVLSTFNVSVRRSFWKLQIVNALKFLFYFILLIAYTLQSFWDAASFRMPFLNQLLLRPKIPQN